MGNDKVFEYIKNSMYILFVIICIAIAPVGVPVVMLMVYMYETKAKQLKYFGNRYYKNTIKVSDTDFVKKLKYKAQNNIDITDDDMNLLEKKKSLVIKLLGKEEGKILENIGKNEYETVLVDMEKRGYLKEYRNKINDSLFTMYFIPLYGFLKLSTKLDGLRSRYCYVLLTIEALLWVDIVYITGTMEGTVKLIGLIISCLLLLVFYALTRYKILGEYLSKQEEGQLEGYLGKMQTVYIEVGNRADKVYRQQQKEKEEMGAEVEAYLEFIMHD